MDGAVLVRIRTRRLRLWSALRAAASSDTQRLVLLNRLVLVIGARLLLIDYCLLDPLGETLFMRRDRNDWCQTTSLSE